MPFFARFVVLLAESRENAVIDTLEIRREGKTPFA